MEAGERFLTDERGADLVEYAFVVGMISIAMAAAINPMMPSIKAMFDNFKAALDSVKW
jgi:Flp pilus assembly pilin Flp